MGRPGSALVPVAGPVDLAGSLDVFRRSGDDLLDRWDGRVWLRALAVGGQVVGVAARPAGTVADPALLVAAEPGADPDAAGRALAGAFLTAPEALAELAAADPVVAGIAARFPGISPVLRPDLLTAVVRSISAQQITLRFAAVLRARLARHYGHRHEVAVPAGSHEAAAPTGGHKAAAPTGGHEAAAPTGVWTTPATRSRRGLPSRSGAPPSRGRGDRSPESGTPASRGGGDALPVSGAPASRGRGDPGPDGPGAAPAEVWSLDAGRLAGASVAELRELQFSTAKAVAVVGFADAVAAGRVGLEELAGLEDEAVVARLVAFPGIGRWTAEWLLARTLGRPRVVAGDLGVRKAVGAAYLGGRMPSEAEVRAATAHWGPAAGVAQQLLLHWLAAEAPTGSRSATRRGRSSRQG